MYFASAKTGLIRLFARLAISVVILVSFPALLAPAWADWRDDIGTLRIGIVASGADSSLFLRTEPFRLAVQEALGINVEIRPIASLATLIRQHAEGLIEYAVLPASGYATAYANCECVEPMVLVRSADGSTTVRSMVIVRASGNIRTAADLLGKKVLVLSENSIVANAFAIHSLGKLGVDISTDNTDIVTLPSAEEAIRRFSEGEGDALVGWSSFVGDATSGYSRGTLRQLHDLSGGSLNAYRTLWTSQPIPQRVHSVKNSLDGEAKRLLRELLVTLHENDPIAYDSIEPVLGGGFETARQSQFTGLIEFLAPASSAGNPQPIPQNKDTTGSSEAPSSGAGAGKTGGITGSTR